MAIESLLPESIRSRYALKLLGGALLIGLLITAFSATTVIDVTDNVRDEQLYSMETNAELEANALAQWIEGNQQTIRALSSHRGLDPAAPEETAAVLAREREALSAEVATLSVVERSPATFSEGTDEQILASTEPTYVGRSLSVTDVNWKPTVGFNFDSTDDVILSWVYTNEDDAALVAVASPTPDGDHVLVGEYRTDIQAESFTSVIDGTKTQVLGGFTAFVLFDENETNVITPYEGDRANTTIGNRILDTDPGAELNGSVLTENSVKGYHSVPGEAVDWVVVKEAPRQNALAVSESIRGDLTTLVGITLLGFLLIGVVIQRGPIRSIQRLARQADAIADGELAVEIEDEGREDEIGDLRTAFRNTKAYIETIASQADALSRQAFDDDAFEAAIPGRIGTAMADMRGDLRRFINELETERQRYSTLVEQSKDGIAVVHGESLVFVNDRLADITGYSREELVGMSYANLVVEEDLAGAHEQAQRVLTDANPADQYVHDIETKTGQRRRIEATGSKIIHDGEPAVLINARDITERQRREQRLTVFNRLLRHNFRNRLDVIKGHAERLADHTEGDHAEAVLTAADRLATLGSRARRIDQLVARDPNPTTVDVVAVINELLESVDTEENETTIETTLPATAELRTDAETLRTTLVSPLENAVKYADSTVQVSVTSTPAGCRVVISDDGPGIPAAELDSLAAGTETDLQHGRGLGLWQLKWGVDALNGDLAFETDAGTTVRIELPALGDNSDERGADADSDNNGIDDSDPADGVDDDSTDSNNDTENNDDTDSEA
ncbi:sensor histidine kinase [Halonotius sp. GCM10025705]|uniref:sensor histidine kinase n=1 Tax=Halonotius sp. GCM10025705 TaxID=3252678 RepID=UPI0036227EC4